MRAAPRSAQDLNSRAADLQLMGIVEGITRSFSRSAAMISVLRLRSLAKPIVPLTSASDPLMSSTRQGAPAASAPAVWLACSLLFGGAQKHRSRARAMTTS